MRYVWAVAFASVVCATIVLATVSRSPQAARADAPSPTPSPVAPYFAADCAPGTPGVQTECNYHAGDLVDIDIVFVNDASPTFGVGATAFELLNPDRSRLVPLSGLDSNLNGNPDFPAVGYSAGFSCNELEGPPAPDNGAAGLSGSASSMFCIDLLYAANSPNTFLTPLSVLQLGTVHYQVPANVAASDVTLAFGTADLFEDVGHIYCLSSSPRCPPTTIHLDGPTVTASATTTQSPTITGTPTITPTATQTPLTSSFSYTLPNTIAPGRMLRVVTGRFLSVDVTSSPAGCPVPGISSANSFGGYFQTTVEWPTLCADVGETTSLTFTVGSANAAIAAFQTFSPFPSYTYLTKPAANASISLDCDVSIPGVQADCAVPPALRG